MVYIEIYTISPLEGHLVLVVLPSFGDSTAAADQHLPEARHANAPVHVLLQGPDLHRLLGGSQERSYMSHCWYLWQPPVSTFTLRESSYTL